MSNKENVYIEVEFLATGQPIFWNRSAWASLMGSSERHDMGIHVTYSARAIANAMVEFDCTQEQLLHYLMRGAKLSRLDVCFDLQNSEIDIHSLYRDAKEGNVHTRSKSIGFVESAKIGREKGSQTLYIGSQKKRKKLLRVYDKGEQLGLGIDLKRFELEMRGDIANNAGLKLKKTLMHLLGS